MYHDMLNFKDISPKVFVTNRVNSLMNHVNTVFTETSTLLYACHIGEL